MLEEVAHRLGFVHDYLSTDETRPRFESFTRGLLRPLFDEIGFAAGVSDTDDRRSLRATVIAALGTIGYDPDIIARARGAVDRALAGTAPLDPTLAGAVIKTAARHGNAALFEALLAAAERAPTPEEHYRYLYALADFREPDAKGLAVERLGRAAGEIAVRHQAREHLLVHAASSRDPAAIVIGRARALA